jgi:hypothetical protein
MAMSDGILAFVVSKRGPVSRVVIVGQTKQSYIVERDGATAHGKTLAEARGDLLLKLGKRDTGQFKAWSRDTVKPIEEMIAAYRAITGACGQGVSHFLSSRSYPAKISVGRVIDDTKGQYGHDSFSSFFKN